MKKLIERFSGFVKGTITGFDRIVFSSRSHAERGNEGSRHPREGGGP